MLRLENVTAGYGGRPVLEDVAISVGAGEIVCIIGPNGAGKSTALRVAAGQIGPLSGMVRFREEDITALSIADRGKKGLIFIPQGVNIFPNLTVLENLDISGLLQQDKRQLKFGIEKVFEEFPVLLKKKDDPGRTLSGGERQMLALARIYLVNPLLVLLDEPSLGLSPLVVDTIFELISDISRSGTSVLLVEQNARKGLSIADRGYVLELGRNRLEGKGKDLLADDEVRRLYLGG
jgi:ABC-type branched-subunit amino acid transport system ATPase component